MSGKRTTRRADEGGEPRPMETLRLLRTEETSAMRAAARAFGPGGGRWGYECVGAALQGLLGMHPERAKQELPEEVVSEEGRFAVMVATFAGWDLERNVYRFDEGLFTELWHQLVTGKIPTQRLYGLPSACCYVEFPSGVEQLGASVMPVPGELKGLFVFVEHGGSGFADALYFVLDLDQVGENGERTPRLHPMAMELVPGGTIADCLRSQYAAGKAGAELAEADRVSKMTQRVLGSPADEFEDMALRLFSPLLAIALRLCSPVAPIEFVDEAAGVRYWKVS